VAVRLLSSIGKFKHVAGFLSKTLLEHHKHFEHCPAFIFDQSREGFRAFIDLCYTTWWSLDLPIFVIHTQRRQAGMIKTDKRDALSLANQLYTQLELRAQVADTFQVIRRAISPSESAAQLKGLMRHRYQLVNEATRRKNKLTAICPAKPS
jgi:hypothetical protein